MTARPASGMPNASLPAPRSCRRGRREEVATSPSPQTAGASVVATGGTVSVWTLDGEKVDSVVTAGGRIWGVAVSPDGTQVATASADAAVSLRPLDDLETVEHRLGHSGVATDVAYSGDGQTVVTTTQSGEVRLWDARSGELLGEPFAAQADRIGEIGESPTTRTAPTSGSPGRTAGSGRPTSSTPRWPARSPRVSPTSANGRGTSTASSRSPAADADGGSGDAGWQLLSPQSGRGFDDWQGHALCRARWRPRVRHERIGTDTGAIRTRWFRRASVATDGHIAPPGSASAAVGSAAAAPGGLAAYDLGVLGQPAKVIGRDGGYTTKIGGEILWGFGDTLFYGPAADGSTYRTNSGDNVPGYYRLDEPLDSSGATAAPLVPLSRSEVAHNQAISSSTYHVWPSGSITQASGQATVFFSVTETDPFEIRDRGVGTATVAPGATKATRASTLLFTQSECPWHSADEANGYVYLFSFLGRTARAGCPHRDGFLPTGIACAPKAEMTNRASYRFWNGTSWTTDQTQTATILAGVPGHLSMAWNDHLGKFLTIYGFGQEESFYTTADQPQGPWAPLQKFHTGRTGTNYFWLQHPTLASPNDDVILVSYLNPTGVLTSQNRLIAVSIDPAAAGRVDDHVHRTYQTLLGRRADGDGLAYWTNASTHDARRQGPSPEPSSSRTRATTLR